MRRPTGVTPRQWRLAAIYPKAASAYAAMVEAGYADSTALKNAKSQLETVGVAKAFAAQEEARQRKRDSASEIKRKAGAKVSTALDSETDPNYALSAWATASKVKAEYPDESNGELSEADLADASEHIRNVVMAVLFATRDDIIKGNFDVITPQLIADIEVKVSERQLTDCTLSDAITPTTLLLPRETATD